ncbi:Glyoxylate/hydroxypyruvate reductase B [Triticum urartu]|uniref:Glyoxylate/hydroxypyruvate reductase B n=1 Tax=Triticum urartu TaxID=4572 RepID=M7YUF6_TRIUA|nr:Glyoxylate/hydroxypyruvate reductase B [Triticum urartu]
MAPTVRKPAAHPAVLVLRRLDAPFAAALHEHFLLLDFHARRKEEGSSRRYTYFPDVRGLAAASDVLVVACALNEETRHVVGREVLDALGKDGVLINVGRGANVDEAALVAALKEGRIAGAGLDVFEDEPKVPAELLPMDNVVLTPHVAVLTQESRSDLRAQTIGNLQVFFSGQPLLTPVPCHRA